MSEFDAENDEMLKNRLGGQEDADFARFQCRCNDHFIV